VRLTLRGGATLPVTLGDGVTEGDVSSRTDRGTPDGAAGATP
jgi:hypothetical protein